MKISVTYFLFISPLLALIFLVTCTTAENSEEVSSRLLEDRRAKEQSFLNHERSPLTATQKKQFNGLNYYPIDLKYRIHTSIREHPSKDTIVMTMSGQGEQQYIRWGEFDFSVEGRQETLQVYKPLSYSSDYHPYFFIPFRDETNGEGTYEGGRYLDIPILESESYIIDFNRAYNPYCAYNSNRWTCPLPPEENTLDFPLRAGEKAFTLLPKKE